jgi:3-deoxy-D-manno-octulosonate 8-phosphate phosphatase (KDO 8-P phosphatase)
MDLKKIKAFAFDIDGVATEGTLLCMPDGDFLRLYDAKDGFAIRMACMNGFHVAVITGGSSESIRKRMTASGIKPEDVFLHCRNKMVEFGQFCERYSLLPEEVMYFGDDIPDVEVMQACGCAVCPSDAVPEAQKAADWVTEAPGGKGCLREAIEKTLKKQDKWVFDPVVYKQRF